MTQCPYCGRMSIHIRPDGQRICLYGDCAYTRDHDPLKRIERSKALDPSAVNATVDRRTAKKRRGLKRVTPSDRRKGRRRT